MYAYIILPSKKLPPPPNHLQKLIYSPYNIFSTKKKCVTFYDLRKIIFYEKGFHVLKIFNCYPHPFEGQSE